MENVPSLNIKSLYEYTCISTRNDNWTQILKDTFIQDVQTCVSNIHSMQGSFFCLCQILNDVISKHQSKCSIKSSYIVYKYAMFFFCLFQILNDVINKHQIVLGKSLWNFRI